MLGVLLNAVGLSVVHRRNFAEYVGRRAVPALREFVRFDLINVEQCHCTKKLPTGGPSPVGCYRLHPRHDLAQHECWYLLYDPMEARSVRKAVVFVINVGYRLSSTILF